MGFYYLNDRYYDSITGRFLTPDDPSYLGANEDLLSYNLFAYCSNNPVMYVDPTGHSSILFAVAIATLIGLAVGAGTEIAKQAYNEGDWNFDLQSWNWARIGGKALIGAANGLAYGLGGVAGGIIKGSIAAFKGLSVAQSVGLLFGTMAVSSFAAGVGSYALNTYGSEDKFYVTKAISEGIGQMGKGSTSFLVGGLFVYLNLWHIRDKSPLGNIIGRTFVRSAVSFVPNYVFDEGF